jgi:hypothetical protein
MKQNFLQLCCRLMGGQKQVYAVWGAGMVTWLIVVLALQYLLVKSAKKTVH